MQYANMLLNVKVISCNFTIIFVFSDNVLQSCYVAEHYFLPVYNARTIKPESIVFQINPTTIGTVTEIQKLTSQITLSNHCYGV